MHIFCVLSLAFSTFHHTPFPSSIFSFPIPNASLHFRFPRGIFNLSGRIPGEVVDGNNLPVRNKKGTKKKAIGGFFEYMGPSFALKQECYPPGRPTAFDILLGTLYCNRRSLGGHQHTASSPFFYLSSFTLSILRTGRTILEMQVDFLIFLEGTGGCFLLGFKTPFFARWLLKSEINLLVGVSWNNLKSIK